MRGTLWGRETEREREREHIYSPGYSRVVVMTNICKAHFKLNKLLWLIICTYLSADSFNQEFPQTTDWAILAQCMEGLSWRNNFSASFRTVNRRSSSQSTCLGSFSFQLPLVTMATGRPSHAHFRSKHWTV